MLDISLHKGVTTVQAAEQPNNCVKSLLCFLIRNTLQSGLQLLIRVGCQIKWCLTTLIHEVLEGRVATFLELHVVVETLFKHYIHFTLQIKQFLCECDRVL